MASGPPPPYAPTDPSKAGYYGYGPQNPGYPPSGPCYPPTGYPPAGAPPPAGFQMPYPSQPGPPMPTGAPPQQQQQQQQVVIIGTPPPAALQPGNCPVCRTGVIIEDYTCCGILMAILFFPLGLICCLLCRDRRCSRCGVRI